MLRNSQGQILQQKLSPQAIQAQLLLAIPTIALDREIKKQLEENPVLEETQDNDNISVNDYGNRDWNNNSFSGSSGFDNDERNEYLINKNSGVKESPVEQLYKMDFDSRRLAIAEEILGNLEDDGYLRIDFREIISEIYDKYGFSPSNDEVELVLKKVQKLDPVGIAARSLQECLSVQLQELSGIPVEEKELCIKMINEHFDDFKLKHFEKLSKLLAVPLEKINELFEIIHRLNPSPGKQDSAADYIYPDFIIKKIDGKFSVELTVISGSGVKISKNYLDLLKSKKTAKDTKEFIRNKIDSAKWFINAIRSRRDTMLKVMKAIVKRQIEFFESRGENLKPMIEKDVSGDIDMDISTVSRVVRGKYAQTDFGIFELKYFFSSSIKTGDGEDVSSMVYKEKIKELIDKEDKTKPLNDDKIAELMLKMGFNIARRTVAKYREAIKIPKATLRRKILL